MRYLVQTFGCQMNVHDSERMEEVLGAHGFTPAATEDDADLIVLNTCSVREKAEQKLRSEVGKLLPLKQKHPELVLCVAGCVAQQEGEKLLKRVPHLDLVIGPDNIQELPALVHAQRQGSPPTARTVFDVDAPQFLSAAGNANAPQASAYVTTMKGCDERCSFCIVPYTRGPERYRPAQEIIDEIQHLVGQGTQEITLLGQTVDSYRDASLPPPVSSDPDESQFPHLLRAIAHRVPSLRRLRYTSPHPRHATPELARAHAELDVLAWHVHMPVQSGADRVLKRMIRRYTRAEYVERVRRLAAARPGLTLSTDIIVGFPGETRAEFEETLSLVREVGFVGVFAFKYSQRPFTPALKLPDDVSEAEKSERLAELFAVSEELTRAHLRQFVGTTQEVLVLGPSKSPSDTGKGTTFQGRTRRNEIVHVQIPTGIDATGAILQASITDAFKHSLRGEVDPAALSALPERAAPAHKRGRRKLPVLTEAR